jgi:DnaJ-class molecular chaperone
VSIDYYSVLGLDKAAGQDQVKTAYRNLALKYHPDRNKDDPAATERMKQLNEAYAVLSDPAKRREYDYARQRYGASASEHYRQTHSQGDIFRGSDIDQVFAEFARQFGFRGFEEVFRDAYGSDFRTFVVRGSGMSGGAYVFRTGNATQEGSAGQPPLTSSRSAPKSLSERLLRWFVKKSTGIELPERGQDWNDKVSVDLKLAERGGEIQYAYRKWGKPKNLMVRIPANTKEGQIIRLTGMGGAGKGGSGAGDLYLKVHLRVSLIGRIKAIFQKN